MLVTTAPVAGTPVVPPLPTPSIFDICILRISSEAAHVINKCVLAGGMPGSEHAHTAMLASSHTRNINPITGLRKHRHNPEGMFCTTVGCNKGDHDHGHCYVKGGGMEGQAPWMKNKRRDKEKETAATAVVTSPTANNTPPTLPPSMAIAAFTGTEAAALMFLTDLSCASITETVGDPNTVTALANLITEGFNTILDLGMTTTLIQSFASLRRYRATLDNTFAASVASDKFLGTSEVVSELRMNIKEVFFQYLVYSVVSWDEVLQEHLDAWAPTIFLLILLVSALASYPHPDLTLVILVILAFPFALYLSLQQSQYIWPDPFADEAYPCSVPPPD
ncbi:uncharacterized protein EDB93DRAFT_1259257 [Suillus bovinus]|uniref:uncharacterized protein n=1 Tax=Suillus bovinus TaxID=48563 RepID=UPI001B85B7B2|nr:uncharacterized protein EDB93DRAFT_1259257 [Suillus bovinus]KAG2122465.1 hypothetical protein EDB93DRAFT_1259257 [Suillus bovinus]